MSQELLKRLPVGSVIDGRYEVVSVLGAGGFGVVFKAKQLSTGQLVAIKLMHPDKLANADDAHIEEARFHREMKLIAKLKHPNIVRLMDTGRLTGGELYTVLELIEGRALDEVLLSDGALPPTEARQIIMQVVDALCCAHEHGIVHRDLKPPNIMIADTGGRRNAMVLDFGIAGIVKEQRDEDYRSLTVEGRIRGTPAYMSPEQFESKTVLPQIDIYACGLVFMECLTGQPAIQGESIAAMLFKHMSPDPIPIPPAIAAHPIGDVIRKAVAKSLDERFATAQEFLNALENCRVHNLDLERPVPEDTSTPPRPKTTLYLAAAVLVALVALLVVPMTQNEDGPSNDETSKLDDSPPPSTQASQDTTPQEPLSSRDVAMTSDTNPVQKKKAVSVVRLAGMNVDIGLDKGELEHFKKRFPSHTFELNHTVAVYVKQSFKRPELDVMTHEVTWADWKAHADTFQKQKLEEVCPGTQPPVGEATHPVTQIGAGEASLFCQAIGMRLPTAKEWEGIARGHVSRSYGFAGDMTPGRAQQLDGQSLGKDVPWNATPEGIFSLSGGVSEWVTCSRNSGQRLEYCQEGYAHRGGSWMGSGTTPGNPSFWRLFWSSSIRLPDATDNKTSGFDAFGMSNNLEYARLFSDVNYERGEIFGARRVWASYGGTFSRHRL